MSAKGHPARSGFEQQPLTVLVADDDEDDRSSIKKAWSKNWAGTALRFVEDGEELIDYLNHSGKYTAPALAPRPEVLMLDLNMPKKNGLEVLREIKANPELRKMLVVVLTTSQAEEDICRSYELGASAYITKPATFGSLVDVLKILGRDWLEVVDVQLPKH
jgi:CheY-like chemotaxis protein